MNILKNLLFFWDNRFQTEENQGIILSGAYKISYIPESSDGPEKYRLSGILLGRIHMGPCIGLLCHCR